MQSVVIFGALLLIFQSSFAGISLVPLQGQPTKNCLISVTAVYKTGEKKTMQYQMQVKNKPACNKTQNLFGKNYDKKNVVQVRAIASWRGK